MTLNITQSEAQVSDSSPDDANELSANVPEQSAATDDSKELFG
jgi:hypothetical protein